MTDNIILTSEEHGCVYSIDSEGTLFYSPMYKDGRVNVEDWTEVDMLSILGEDESIQLLISDIHERLIALNKVLGWYYTN